MTSVESTYALTVALAVTFAELPVAATMPPLDPLEVAVEVPVVPVCVRLVARETPPGPCSWYVCPEVSEPLRSSTSACGPDAGVRWIVGLRLLVPVRCRLLFATRAARPRPASALLTVVPSVSTLPFVSASWNVALAPEPVTFLTW